MANTTIQLKHSTLTGNVPSSLANGEISIISRDGKFFYSTPAGVVTTHYPYLGPAGLNQEVQFNDSGVLGSDSGLTYNKTTDVLTVVGGAIVGGVNVTPQIQLAFTQANTPSYTANSAASYANSGFAVSNSAALYANAGFSLANGHSAIANSAATYANGAFTKANNALPNATGTFAGTLSVTETFKSLQSIGDEGGQIDLATAATNQSLSGGTISIDVFQNKLRIFESGGTNRGVYIDLANGASASVGTNLLAPSNSTDGWARGQANASFATANSAASYANAAFSTANSASGAAAASSYANSAFSKANSACTAAASAQSTADSAYNTYDIASIYTPNNSTTVSATGRSDTVNLVGTAGIYIFSNTATKTITVAGGIQSLPGAQGMTVDYGYVSEAVYYAIDYGTL